MSTARVATYRIQFRNGMTFDRAVDAVPYLTRLGISHLYASPIFTATTGSSHGYDVTDHNEIDPAVGGREGFERLSEVLKRHGMGLVLDIVPNHMAASLENAWWRSVVELGADSPYAGHFDIDWSRKLTLPILGRDYRDVLAGGELFLKADPAGGCLALAYFDKLIPLHPSSYPMVAASLPGDLAAQLTAIAHRRSAGPGAGPEARALFSSVQERLCAALDGLSRDRVLIDAVHAQQAWRLMFWQEARRTLSYRRFFEVTGLAGVRVEDAAVFEDVHRLALMLVRDGLVDGLRVDHVDGLAEPTAYLRRLRERAGEGAWLMVEKILGEGEQLPHEWREMNVGTTGYEFIPAVANLLVEAQGATRLRNAYRRWDKEQREDAEGLRAAKLLILTRNFEGELASLVEMAFRLTAAKGSRSRGAIEDALVELIVAFPVYRTYAEPDGLSDQDREVLEGAAVKAVEAGADPSVSRSIIELVGETRGAAFRTRLQQLTGPVMAKAVEDTLFYRNNALIALNEVGAPPLPSILGVEAFHGFMAARAGDRSSLVATSTHDTKRGEDARARLYALASEPGHWEEAVERWSRLNERLRVRCGASVEPSVEWLLYQALAGAWPSEAWTTGPGHLRDRFLSYVEKALREAKLRTDWIAVDESFEREVLCFAGNLLDADNAGFLDDFDRTLQPVIRAGNINALSQLLAKLTGPGVPDIYQGSERGDFSLVDPDNRRPVDFDALARSMEAQDATASPSGFADLKQWLTARILAARAAYPELFIEGSHVPLAITGADAGAFVAYLREHRDRAALVVLHRGSNQLPSPPSDARELTLPRPFQGRNVLTGGRLHGAATLPLHAVLDGLPVALCITEREH